MLHPVSRPFIHPSIHPDTHGPDNPLGRDEMKAGWMDGWMECMPALPSYLPLVKREHFHHPNGLPSNHPSNQLSIHLNPSTDSANHICETALVPTQLNTYARLHPEVRLMLMPMPIRNLLIRERVCILCYRILLLFLFPLFPVLCLLFQLSFWAALGLLVS